METKSVTIGDFIDAIEKNGLPLITGKLFVDDAEEHEYDSYPRFDMGRGTLVLYDAETGETPVFNSKIVSACAFGQGLINIGAALDTYLLTFLTPETREFYRQVYYLNDMTIENGDEQRYTLTEIVALLRQEYLGREDVILTFIPFDYTPYLEK